MCAAPAFAFEFQLGRGERFVLACIGAGCAAALAAWGWSYVDASAGLAGRGMRWWVVWVGVAGVAGFLCGWWASPRTAGTVAWREGQWTWQPRGSAHPQPGTVQPMFDLGSWMLLRFAPDDGGAACWLTAGRRAGAAWHALRATLFAPGPAVGGARGKPR